MLRCNSLLAWHTRRRLFTGTCAATIDCGPLPAAVNWHGHKMAEHHGHTNSQRGEHLQALCNLIRQYNQGPRVGYCNVSISVSSIQGHHDECLL